MYEKVLPAVSEPQVGGTDPSLMDQDPMRSPGEGRGRARGTGWGGGRTTVQPGEGQVGGPGSTEPLGGAARRPCGASGWNVQARSRPQEAVAKGGRKWLSCLLTSLEGPHWDVRSPGGGGGGRSLGRRGRGRRGRGQGRPRGSWRGRWRHSPRGPGLRAESTWHCGVGPGPSPALRRDSARQADLQSGLPPPFTVLPDSAVPPLHRSPGNGRHGGGGVLQEGGSRCPAWALGGTPAPAPAPAAARSRPPPALGPSRPAMLLNTHPAVCSSQHKTPSSLVPAPSA